MSADDEWTYPQGKTVDDLLGRWAGGKYRQGVLRPGVLAEIRTSQGKEMVLIGHVNDLMGTCDDCRDLVAKTDRVIRYKTVWKP